jgi:hypothetical protein
MSPFSCPNEHFTDQMSGGTMALKIIIEIMDIALAKRGKLGYSYRHNDYRDK